MTEKGSVTGNGGVSDTGRRRAIAIAAGAAVVVVGAGLVVALTVGGGGVPSPTNSISPAPGAAPSATESPSPAGPSASATAKPTPKPTSSAPPAEVDPDFGQPVVDRADSGKSADFGDDVTVRMSSAKTTTASGSQVGEVSGPAVRVTLRLTNHTGASLKLGSVVVNAYYGSDSVPASPVESDAKPFHGSLKDGATAKASYVFSVPKGMSDDLVVTVSRGESSSVVVLEP